MRPTFALLFLTTLFLFPNQRLYPQNGLNYYRLKQIDFDGTFAYSDPVSVTIQLQESFELIAAYPNPFNPTTQFELAVATAQHVGIDVVDMTGRVVRRLFA